MTDKTKLLSPMRGMDHILGLHLSSWFFPTLACVRISFLLKNLYAYSSKLDKNIIIFKKKKIEILKSCIKKN